MNGKAITAIIHKVLLVVVVLCAVASNSSAQFNVRIGYSLGFVTAKTNNQLFSIYNQQRSLLFDQYTESQDLNLLYGISLGARYKFGLGSLELNWETLGRTVQNRGRNIQEQPLPVISISEEFQYSLNFLMLTYETNFNRIGVGSSIGKNFVSIKKLISGDSDKLPLLDSNSGEPGGNHYVARFHIAFNFYGNGTVAFAIKPFVQFSITDSDLSPMADFLQVSNENTKEGFPMWGLAFAFYNGRQ